MPPTPFPISPTLDAALSRWEEHARPGLPDRGFSLGRAAGGSSRGIYAAGSQRPVFETREHILRMAVAPGRMWLDEFGDTGSPEGRREVRAISPLHRARAIPVGVRRPRYLGIVLSEDSRVNRDDTEELAAALRTGGGDAAVWEAPRAGHGGNHLDGLHDLGAVLLTFAAHTTGHIFPLRGPDE